MITVFKFLAAMLAVSVGFFSARVFSLKPSDSKEPVHSLSVPQMVKRQEAMPAIRKSPKPNSPENIDSRSLKQISPKLPEVQDYKKGLVITGKTPHRLILFTFDDGPDLKNTPRLLDKLDELGIKAVFFLTTERFERKSSKQLKRAELVRDIQKRGHFIGNHTSTHPQLPLLRNDEIVDELDKSAKVLKRILGKSTWLFRPPGGARSFRTDKIVEKKGYTQMLWNLGAGDFQVETPLQVLQTWKKVFARRQKEVGDQGGIILLHDTHSWSVDAVTLIANDIQKQNCMLLEKGEELYDIVDDPSFFFMERGQADWGTEAPPVYLDPDILEQRQQKIRSKLAKVCG